MNKISHLYSCHAAGLRFVGASTQADVASTVLNRMLHAVEPGVFVAAAEHERLMNEASRAEIQLTQNKGVAVEELV